MIKISIVDREYFDKFQDGYLVITHEQMEELFLLFSKWTGLDVERVKLLAETSLADGCTCPPNGRVYDCPIHGIQPYWEQPAR